MAFISVLSLILGFYFQSKVDESTKTLKVPRTGGGTQAMRGRASRGGLVMESRPCRTMVTLAGASGRECSRALAALAYVTIPLDS